METHNKLLAMNFSLVIIMLVFASCSVGKDYDYFLPAKLPESASNIESEAKRIPGYKLWRVFVKFRVDKSAFKDFARRSDLILGTRFTVPIAAVQKPPNFWRMSTSTNGEALYYRSPAGFARDGIKFRNLWAAWSKDEAVSFYFRRDRLELYNSWTGPNGPRATRSVVKRATSLRNAWLEINAGDEVNGRRGEVSQAPPKN
jgi:hypothetical protein